MQPPPRASPRRTVGRWETSSLFFPQQPSSDATLLCSHCAPLLPHCYTPLLQAPKRRPPRTALVCLCATSSRPLSHRPPQAIRRSTEPAASFGCRGHPPIERHLWSPTCSSITAATSARAHRHSTNPEPALSTTSPVCRRRFPTADLHHHLEPTMVSPSAAYAPNRDPYLRGLLPGTSFPGRSPPVGRNRPASHAR
jgi:hypothetical protein